jgi:cellulose 1,4-beta-cellobiosidase
MFQQRIFAILSVTLAASACSSLGHRPGGTAAEGDVDPAKAAASRRNPFVGTRFFVNPDYVEEVESSAKLDPSNADVIRKVKQYPTGLWLDSIAQLQNVPGWLDAARKQQQETGVPTVPLFVVYDLPNRDCSAKASAGELKVAQNGMARYKSEFIDPLAELFKKYSDIPIVAVIEPDSLPNMATNMNLPTCIEAKPAYLEGVAYAIQKLGMSNVTLYLDAAHAGWLGWDNNREAAVKIFKTVLKMAGGVDTIRGFATNTSGYTHLYNRDGMAMEPTNPCYNESVYVKKLAVSLSDHGIRNKGFIIDTARNGKGKIRKVWGNWCNIKGAGLGERPQVNPAPFIDAYFWIKPPGESDGVSDPSQPRYDPMCSSSESAQNAPQAGKWFHSYFMDLVRNATPPL